MGRSLYYEKEHGIFAKNCKDLWGFKKIFFLQVLDKWIALSFALRNRSPEQIPHNAATKYIP